MLTSDSGESRKSWSRNFKAFASQLH